MWLRRGAPGPLERLRGGRGHSLPRASRLSCSRPWPLAQARPAAGAGAQALASAATLLLAAAAPGAWAWGELTAPSMATGGPRAASAA